MSFSIFSIIFEILSNFLQLLHIVGSVEGFLLLNFRLLFLDIFSMMFSRLLNHFFFLLFRRRFMFFSFFNIVIDNRLFPSIIVGNLTCIMSSFFLTFFWIIEFRFRFSYFTRIIELFPYVWLITPRFIPFLLVGFLYRIKIYFFFSLFSGIITIALSSTSLNIWRFWWFFSVGFRFLFYNLILFARRFLWFFFFRLFFLWLSGFAGWGWSTTE